MTDFSANGREDIAITGMSCLFPSAADVDAYWNNILNGVSAISDPPPGSWDTSIYYDPNISDSDVAVTDKVYCKRGGYLGSLAQFTPLKHGIPPVNVGGEPDQWLALQLARDAMVDAGCEQLPEAVRQRTAVILGKGTYLNGGNAAVTMHSIFVGQTLALIKSLNPEYTDEQMALLRSEMKKSLPPVGPETVPGLVPNVIVGRIANRLDLMGPTYTVDAACASSLVAVDHAVRDLRSGACDLALVGGSQVWIPVPTLNIFCQLSALSRRQEIRPFDKDADGTLLGEGIGMLVLKRLADAERDDDRIYAVIKGVGVASDGRAVGVMAPRVEGEELALRRAYAAAGVDPRSVGLIEAHGTGTPVGDAVEIQALKRVFGSGDQGLPRCAIGSVKSMISHTMPAAGVAGIIKTALALHHRILPPTLNCAEPNPKFELDKSPFYINTETRPWIHAGPAPRRAGVNAFGFGGINAHVVLEEYPEDRRAARPVRNDRLPSLSEHAAAWDSDVVVLEAESPEALRTAADGLLLFLGQSSEKDDYRLVDLAASVNAALGRIAEPYRLAIVATSLEDLQAKLERAIRKLADPKCRQIKDVGGIYYAAQPLARQGTLAFLCPGEGAQYPNMLADLCQHLPEVRQCFDRSDRIFRDHPRSHVLSDYLFPRPAFSESEREWAVQRLSHLDGAIESVLSSNQALLTVVHHLGIKPDAIVGHSTGEYSAMQAAGILDLDTEERIADFTLQLNQKYESAAARDEVPRAVLLAVGAARAEVERIAAEAGGEVYMAMDNCPHQTVLVGQPEAVERALELVKRAGYIYEYLTFDRAYHTPLFAPYTDQLRTVFEQATIRPPKTAVYSCTTAAPYPTDAAEVRELMVDHWVRPVEFRQTIETLYAQGTRLFVEVGPRGNLTSFVEDILRGRPFCAIPANVQRRSGVAQINHLAGLLAAHGVTLNLEYLYERRSPQLVDWRADAPTTPTAPPVAIALGTAQPMIRFPADVLRQLAELAPDVMLTQSAAPPTVAAPPPTVAAPAPPSPPAARQAIAPAHAPRGLDHAGPPKVAASTAMRGYFQSMDAFLATQQQVMGAYLGAGPKNGRSAARFPLLGRVTAHSPGRELVAERTFSLADDLYLRDHTLGGAVSRADPTLLALAVMPLTMSLEILAEAAARLAGGRTVVGLRDVVAYRWLSWGDEPQVLQVTARSEPGSPGVLVRLRNLTEDAQAQEPSRSPVLEATVLLADRYNSATRPTPRALALEDGRPSGWQPEQLYSEVMFHGPLWRGVSGIQRTGREGIIAQLRSLPFSGLIRSIAEPQFELDPIALDAAGQVIGFWTAAHLTSGAVIFPFRLARLDVYGPRPPVGEAQTCTAAVQLVGSQQVRSNIDVVCADGRLWMRLDGWEDKRFALPARFQALVANGPAGAEISERWADPIREFGEPGLFECRRVAGVPESDRSFWAKIWAHRMLSRMERRAFNQLQLPEAEQLDWLAARTAAKEAVQSLLRGQGIDVLPADVEITEDRDGRVSAEGTWRRALATPPVVTIARGRGSAVALASLARGAEAHVLTEAILKTPRLDPSITAANTYRRQSA